MKIKNPIEVNLILVGKTKIQKLNYIYRRKNKPTDVLSFPIDITDPKQLKAKSYKLVLGDIYICPELVETHCNVPLPVGKKTIITKKDLIKTYQEIFLHGLIHLIGYDHEKNEEEWNKIEKLFNHY